MNPIDYVVTLLAALRRVARTHDGKPCWCEMAIGHPLVTTHTDKCKQAGEAAEAGSRLLESMHG